MSSGGFHGFVSVGCFSHDSEPARFEHELRKHADVIGVVHEEDARRFPLDLIQERSLPELESLSETLFLERGQGQVNGVTSGATVLDSRFQFEHPPVEFPYEFVGVFIRFHTALA